MIAYIIASGLGTRLKEFDPITPKGLFPIHGIPFMEYLLNELNDMSNIYITSNRENFKAYQKFIDNYSIRYSIKNIGLFEIFGSFDDVLFNLDNLIKPTEAVCLCCCDNIAVLKYRLASFENDIITDKYDQIIISPKIKNWYKYGVLTISDDKSYVTSFKHNNTISEKEKNMNDEMYIDGGITITCHDFVNKIKNGGGFEKYMEKSLLSKRVGYYEPMAWFDIGNMESYNDTCQSSLFQKYFNKGKVSE